MSVSTEITGKGVTYPATLHGLCLQQAASTPDAAALLAPGGCRLTYRQLLAHMERLASALRASGVKPGDRIGVVLPNGPEMALAFLGIASVATCAPLNPTYTEGEFDFYLGDLDAKALVVASGVESPARTVAQARGIPILSMNLGELSRNTTLLAEGNAVVDSEPINAGEADVALVLHTSGTTSRPKMVPLTQANLIRSAQQIRESLCLTPTDRCLNIMPLFHIHGLVGALLSSIAAGGGIVCTPGFLSSHFFTWIDEFAPTWYTAVPTMHQSILTRAADHRDIIQRHPLRFIRSCSASLPPQLMAEIESVFSAPVIEAYGMTEASHQIACNPLPPRERKPGTVGVPTGVAVAIMNADGRLLPLNQQGEIVLKGSTITSGYADNPEANETAFAHDWFHTGDQGIIDADGYLAITGRMKELINRGGEKIAPREVDEVILAHPAVAQAVTFAIPHAQLGEDIAAAVVLHDGASTTEKEVRDFVAAQLAAFKVPALVIFCPEIPKGPTGKVQRIGLAAKLGLDAPGIPPTQPIDGTPPRTPVEEELCHLWAQVLGVQQMGIFSPFLHIGGDSMLATLLLSRIRDAYAIDLPFYQFFEASTIAEQAVLVTEALATRLAGDEQLDQLLDALEKSAQAEMKADMKDQ